MIVVPTYSDKSQIHGTGLFAAKSIKKGDVVWRFDPMTDIRLPKFIVDSWAKKSREHVEHFCVLVEGNYIYSLDNSIYVNHSDSPNIGPFSSYDDIIALRDISPDEEITTKYFEFEGSKKKP